MKKALIWLLVLALLAFLAGVAVVVKPFNSASTTTSKAVTTTDKQPQVKVQREVILYFGAIDEPLLEQQMRSIDECDSEQECIAGLIQALIAGPKNGAGGDSPPQYEAVLPRETLLLGSKVIDETAWLNFNQALISHHPGGSSSELLTVHAIINTLAANLPHIRALVLQVDGKRINTLRGHVDLRQPVVADFSLVRQHSEVPTVEDAPSAEDGLDQTGENIK